MSIPSDNPPNKGGGNWGRFTGWITNSLPEWIRYIYYLRFSILLWLFPIALRILNSPKVARTLMSGIVTPITLSQYLCVAFFMISGGFVALVQAHVVVINGGDRFGDKPPKLLVWLFDCQTSKWEWVAPLSAQASNFYFFYYLYSNGEVEGVDQGHLLLGVIGGLVLALIFWYVITAIYYLLYQDAQGTGAQTAKTLIFPRWALGLDIWRFGDVLERASTNVSLKGISGLFPAEGYRYTKTVTGAGGATTTQKLDLFEGHLFSLIAAVGFYALYWVLWPVTAPIAVPRLAWGAIAFFCLLAFFVCLFICSASLSFGAGVAARTIKEQEGKLIVWKFALTALIVVFTASIPYIYWKTDAERFPILASIMILVISLSWTLCGIAFFADRFRVPVLTVFVLMFILPRVIPSPCGGSLAGAGEEHYISYSLGNTRSTLGQSAALPTPGEVLDKRLQLLYCGGNACDKLPPNVTPTLIVVTSTGGGIHAAAWTDAVLAQLEPRFENQFHQKVVLFSTVSGGSVGLLDYLREIDPHTNGSQPDWTRMLNASRCSSLEAVGWGLVYWDMQKASVPFFPYLFSPSAGQNDLFEGPIGKDRTWALRRAMVRNLDDEFCNDWAYHYASDSDTAAPKPGREIITLNQVKTNQAAAHDEIENLTLSSLKATPDTGEPFPAFTMNTTTVEGGNRFLLSNYAIPEKGSQGGPVARPASSFLALYNSSNTSSTVPIDLPLATAAQMSATFPFVSSAATLKIAKPDYRAHFVDGGYYDNDGTVSAIEFLRYALEQSRYFKSDPSGNTPTVKLRILLVEIRNSYDGSLNATPSNVIPAIVDTNDLGKPWNALSQLTGPLNGFWSAGHDSITARNRNALGLLEGAYHHRLELQHFVIDDEASGTLPLQCVPPGSKTPNDPLNWYLTPCQQKEVDRSAQGYAKTYNDVKACFDNQHSSECPISNVERQSETQ